MTTRPWAATAAAAAVLGGVAGAPAAHAAFDGEFVRKLCVADGTVSLSPVDDASYASAGLPPITYRREQPLPVRVYQFEQRADQTRHCTVIFASSRDGTPICEEVPVTKTGVTLTIGTWNRTLCPSQRQ